MSKSGSGSKRLALALVWLAILGGLGAAYKFILAPKGERDLVDRTSSTESDFDGRRVRLAIDSFSGYALFRSEELRSNLRSEGLALALEDDGADYERRLRRLASGDVDLALFTVDALLQTTAQRNDSPGTIVLIVDETRGADAMVARKSDVPDLDALNHEDAKIFLTPGSPSETLARIVQRDFDLSRMSSRRAWVEADGAESVYRELQSGGGGKRSAYVLWEPYVSRALADPDVHVLVDSSEFKGYVVDVLVAGRRYLDEHPDDVLAFVRSYLRASYEWQQKRDGMERLVRADARALGEALTEEQASRLVQGIWWKNTQENYDHMGVLGPGETRRLQPLPEMIRRIADLLVRTDGIDKDPTGGRPSVLFYNAVLGRLRDEQFHPGMFSGTGEDPESVRVETSLPALSDDQWEELIPVGTLEVERLVFARGTARLTTQSRRVLEGLAETLESWPLYYVDIRGFARPEGDPEANRRLAADRAREAADFLVGLGVPEARMRAFGMMSPKAGGSAQTVRFVLGKMPF